jgi:ABC-2 type transport system permease protein
MSARRIMVLIGKGLRLGPQNPLLIFALIVPFVYTVVFQALFGAFAEPAPVIVAFERGEERLIEALRDSGAVHVLEADSAQAVRRLIGEQRGDIGVIFPADLIEEIERRETAPGEGPVKLDVFINGDSPLKNRTIAAAALLDILRQAIDTEAEVDFRQVQLGRERPLTIIELLLPLVVLVAVLFGGLLLPAAFLIQEKEKKTLVALLATPVSLLEVIAAFGILGAGVAMLMGLVVLALNVGLNQPVLLLAALAGGSILMAEWGLAAGLLLKDLNSLFANLKLLGLFFYAPAIIFLFPGIPQWVAQVFPTYYIVNPVFRVSVFGEGWAEVGWQLLVLLGLIVVSAFPLVLLAKRAAASLK